MIEPRFCIDCRWIDRSEQTVDCEVVLCLRARFSPPNLVTGVRSVLPPLPAAAERSPYTFSITENGLCGPSARFFEPQSEGPA